MKIIIIQFKFNKPGKGYDPDEEGTNLNYMFPLGLPYISAMLKQFGYNVTCLNLNHRAGTVGDVVYREMFARDYDVAFVGGLSLFYPHIRDLIGAIRIASPKTKIVCGGGIITAQPEFMMGLLKPDFGISGEGELAAETLVHCLDYGQFPPVDKHNVITSEPIKNLDELPFPDYDGFNFAEYTSTLRPSDFVPCDIVDNPRIYPMVASRSCPFNCTFCFHPLGPKYRQRSVDNIMAEIRQAVERYQVNIFVIYDELFSHSLERVREFCDKFKEYSDSLPQPLYFYCNLRVDSTTDEMLKIMKTSGAYLLAIGLESYSKTVLDSMQKKTSPEQIDRVVKLVRENSLGLQGNFIFGDPAETLETAEETLRYVREHRDILGAGVLLNFVVPFQGSKIYSDLTVDEMKLLADRERTGYPLVPVNMTGLSDTDFQKLQEMVFEENMNAPVIIGGRESVCPSCGSKNYVDVDVPWFGLPRNVGCYQCNFRYNLVSPFYPVVKSILLMIGSRNAIRLTGARLI